MASMVGTWQIFIILVILLIFFGPSRLEKLGPALGKAIRGFKKGIEDPESDSESDEGKAVKKSESKISDSEKTKAVDAEIIEEDDKK